MNGYKETLNKPVPENINREQGAMPQPMDHGHPVDLERQCEAKVRNSHHRCKKPATVDRHFCAYHSGLAGPRFDPMRDINHEALEHWWDLPPG